MEHIIQTDIVDDKLVLLVYMMRCPVCKDYSAIKTKHGEYYECFVCQWRSE